MLDKYLKKHTHLDSSKEAWETSWRKQKFSFANIVDIGRRVYNYFFLRFARKHVNQETDFVEFGCGMATLGVILAKDMKRYTGYDIADNALEEAVNNFKKSGRSNYCFEIRDITNTEHNKQFDVVWSQGLIEHFDDTRSVIFSHINATKPGGQAIIIGPAKYSYHHFWYLATRHKRLRRFWPWPDGLFISKKKFNRHMAELKGHYTRYKIIGLKPRVLGLYILIIER